jgi:hypothetical protein
VTRPGTIADADPVPVVVSYLRGRADVTAAFGAGRVGKENVPPYPRLRVSSPPSGSDRFLGRLVAPVVRLEALGDLDGTPGAEVLRRCLYVALGALAALPAHTPGPGEPIVTYVESNAAGGESPTVGGQPRWLAEVRVYLCHPDTVPT